MKNKDKMYIARVETEEKETLQVVAAATGMKESEIVRQGTNERVRKLKKTHPKLRELALQNRY